MLKLLFKMDTKFEKIYETIDQIYLREASLLEHTDPLLPPTILFTPRSQATYVVQRAIQDALNSPDLASYTISLRPDALHFLRINFTEMIALPLLSAARISRDELTEIIHRDLTAIFLAAMDTFGKSEEISAHDILEVVGARWRSLNVSQYNIWG